MFDAADRVTSSPGRTGYVYDAHGNVTSFTRTGIGVVSFTYDEYDHATVINDGTTKTEEWLAPSGRVLHRKVTTLSSGTVTENVVFGYAGGGDSPAWSQPAAGGTVTSFVGGAVIVGSTITFNATNVHGDVIGTVDAAGVMSLVVTADEFGRGGTPPGSRLGWLGGAARFTAAPALGIVRMGVRLYDPEIGRFLAADPVIGGSCNAYDYVCGDPINGRDLDGNWSFNLAGIQAILKTLVAIIRWNAAVQANERARLNGYTIAEVRKRILKKYAQEHPMVVQRDHLVISVSFGSVFSVNFAYSDGHFGGSFGCCSIGSSVNVGVATKAPCDRNNGAVGIGASYGGGGYASVGVKKGSGDLDMSDREAGFSVGGRAGGSFGPQTGGWIGCG